VFVEESLAGGNWMSGGQFAILRACSRMNPILAHDIAGMFANESHAQPRDISGLFANESHALARDIAGLFAIDSRAT
jgi:hypothetical protein